MAVLVLRPAGCRERGPVTRAGGAEGIGWHLDKDVEDFVAEWLVGRDEGADGIFDLAGVLHLHPARDRGRALRVARVRRGALHDYRTHRLEALGAEAGSPMCEGRWSEDAGRYVREGVAVGLAARHAAWPPSGRPGFHGCRALRGGRTQALEWRLLVPDCPAPREEQGVQAG